MEVLALTVDRREVALNQVIELEGMLQLTK
jgi:hypothetical protein